MGVHRAARQLGAWQRKQEHKLQGSLAGAQAVWCHSFPGHFNRMGDRKKKLKGDIWIINGSSYASGPREPKTPQHREMWLFIPSSYPSAARQSTQHWQCSPGPDWCWLNQFPRDLPEAGRAAGALHFGFQNQKKPERKYSLPPPRYFCCIF